MWATDFLRVSCGRSTSLSGHRWPWKTDRRTTLSTQSSRRTKRIIGYFHEYYNICICEDYIITTGILNSILNFIFLFIQLIVRKKIICWQAIHAAIVYLDGSHTSIVNYVNESLDCKLFNVNMKLSFHSFLYSIYSFSNFLNRTVNFFVALISNSLSQRSYCFGKRPRGPPTRRFRSLDVVINTRENLEHFFMRANNHGSNKVKEKCWMVRQTSKNYSRSWRKKSYLHKK